MQLDLSSTRQEVQKSLPEWVDLPRSADDREEKRLRFQVKSTASKNVYEVWLHEDGWIWTEADIFLGEWEALSRDISNYFLNRKPIHGQWTTDKEKTVVLTHQLADDDNILEVFPSLIAEIDHFYSLLRKVTMAAHQIFTEGATTNLS